VTSFKSIAVGDAVSKDQPLLELKPTRPSLKCQHPSVASQAIHVQAGDKAAVGQRIVTLETAGQEVRSQLQQRGQLTLRQWQLRTGY
jgi:multidrug efflux pump subunit AcrA (membrane-fusion protein)